MSGNTSRSSGAPRLVDKKFPLRRITPLSKDIEDFQSFLRDNLPPSDWMIASRPLLALTILHRIRFRHPVANTPDAIAAACIVILRKVRLETEVDPIHRFLESIVGVGSLPSRERDILLNKALGDLREVDALLERYEEQECVRKYRDEGKRGDDHQENISITFYLRCSRSHREITNFLTRSLDSVALENARAALFEHNPLWGLLRSRAPYSFGEYGTEEIDSTKIDRCRHRMMKLPIRVSHKLREIYHAGDTARFYRLLHKHNPPEKVFEHIERTCSSIPDLRARVHIFDELRTLYKHRHWLAFAALSLPQVEGLFADMLKLAGLDKPGKALPAKVSQVRKYYSFHFRTFDYFQFTLPELRNRFAHGGAVDNPRETALDLLHDLGYVVGVFEHLKVPAMSIRKVINNPEKYLSSLKNLNTFIESVRETHRQKKFDNVKDELERFIASYFTGERAFDTFTHSLVDDVDNAIQELAAALKQVAPEIDLSSSSSQELHKAWLARQSEMSAATNAQQNLIDYFEDARYFAKHAPDTLGPLPPTASRHLETIEKTHKIFWNNLKRLKHLSTDESSVARANGPRR